MFGWSSLAAARTSRWKRSSASGLSTQRPADDLDGHRPLHDLVLGLVDDAHAALAEQAEDAVPRMVAKGRPAARPVSEKER